MPDFDIQTRNLGLDLVRVTEAAALAGGRWIGSGNYTAAHKAATEAMYDVLDTLGMSACVVIGEEREVDGQALLGRDTTFGSGESLVDLAADPIDGTKLLIAGKPGAISVIGIAPRGSMWSPYPAEYLEKIVVDQEAAEALVPECMDAPAAWTLALVARMKKKPVRDLVVAVLDRVRHQDLIEEIRSTGARILLRDEGDAEGALEAATPGSGVDLLLGIGGAAQGVLAACAVKAMDGAMLARLAPQSAEEREAIQVAGLDEKQIWTHDQMVQTDRLFFAATGITESALLPGIVIQGSYAKTYSLLIRSETGTRRFIQAEHAFLKMNNEQ
jgi:fructose-1,6-bisphosphatase II